MEAPDALILAELSLRNLIRTVIGTGWRELEGLPSDDDLLRRKSSEEAKRDGVKVSQDLMDYLYIKDLKNIINQRRGLFKEVFPKASRFNELVHILVDYRNTPFHARSLMWFESDLLTGAAGWIVTNITHWRNERERREHDYPEVLSVVDDIGNRLSGEHEQAWNGVHVSLDVGQTVSFACQGSDADGRSLIWRLYVKVAPEFLLARPLAEARGESATLFWTPLAKDVSPEVRIYVTLTAEDIYPSRYGGPDDRYQQYDESVGGVYAVLRPRMLKPRSSTL